jgi:hypothetical protein
MTPVTIIFNLLDIIVGPAEPSSVLNFSRIEFGSRLEGDYASRLADRGCHLFVMWARSP